MRKENGGKKKACLFSMLSFCLKIFLSALSVLGGFTTAGICFLDYEMNRGKAAVLTGGVGAAAWLVLIRLLWGGCGRRKEGAGSRKGRIRFSAVCCAAAFNRKTVDKSRRFP